MKTKTSMQCSGARAVDLDPDAADRVNADMTYSITTRILAQQPTYQYPGLDPIVARNICGGLPDHGWQARLS